MSDNVNHTKIIESLESKAPFIILGIESSCDDTSAAIIRDGKMLSNIVASQEIHRQYGGVVPELASRAHTANIVPVVDAALQKAGIDKNELSAIAFTKGPGLLGSLLVGANFAKSLSLVLDIPLIEVHHMQAHIMAHFIDDPKPKFPFICLTVSGGHTQIVKVNDDYSFEILGQTIDDAAGEAFDKISKMLGLPYPGGPMLDQLAQKGNPTAYYFPSPVVKGLDFSFSGLKTNVLYFLNKSLKENPEFIHQHLNDLCASVQFTIVRILMEKLKKAAQQSGIKQIALAGGVSANSELRRTLKLSGEKMGWSVYIPDFQYCTDNAGMIAMTGHIKYLQGEFCDLKTAPQARWEM